jgi:preprotein translocase subunit SecF
VQAGLGSTAAVSMATPGSMLWSQHLNQKLTGHVLKPRSQQVRREQLIGPVLTSKTAQSRMVAVCPAVCLLVVYHPGS